MRPNKIAVKVNSMAGSIVKAEDLGFDEWIDLCVAFEVKGDTNQCAGVIAKGLIEKFEDWRETWFGDSPVTIVGVKLYREATNEAQGQQLSVDQIG